MILPLRPLGGLQRSTRTPSVFLTTAPKMDIYICEKPSQGKDLAAALKARQYKDGYILGDGMAVTWAIGHLLELFKPEDYDEAYKEWNLSNLPLIPSQWKYAVKEKTAKQFNVIAELVKKASTVYIATDYDREGEAIARTILDQLQYRGRIRRVCLTALDSKSIAKALNNIKEGSETVPLYHSALARSRADFLVGMNLSRLYSVLAQAIGFREPLQIGRVLTATVYLVCERDRAIATFTPKPYWTIKATVATAKGSFQAAWVPPSEHSDELGRCINPNLAKAALQACSGKIGQIANATTTPKTQGAELPFCLTSLQQYANKRWGYTADDVLSYAQALYEKHKLTTYPRTDSRYLPEEQRDEVPDVMLAIKRTDPSIAALVDGADLQRKCRVFDTNKVIAHHAIIPTFEQGSIAALSEEERNIYDAIRRFYLAQFYPAHEYLSTEITVVCTGQTFISKGSVPTLAGWKAVFGSDFEITPRDEDEVESDEPAADATLPPVSTGDACQVARADLGEKTTRPLPYFTEAALLAAMENIGRFETNVHLKKILAETAGIGTPATRAALIKGAVLRNQLTRKGRSIRATAKAHALMAILPPAIKLPSMTAMWEQEMEKIASGSIPMDAFIQQITQWITTMVAQLKAAAPELAKLDGPIAKAFEGAKPASHECVFSCGGQMNRVKGSNGFFWGCQNPECKKTCNDSRGKPQKPVAGADDAPDCELCNSPTKLRKGKPKDGKRAQYFWGCTNYPGCNGTLPYVKPKAGASDKIKF